MNALRPLCLLALAAALLSGCADSPTAPGHVENASGDVVNAAGTPVANAEIRLFYTLVPVPAPTSAIPVRADDLTPVIGPRSFFLSNNPVRIGQLRIDFAIPNDGVVTVVVANREGVVRRTLADRAFAAGTHAMIWDGLDDAAVPVAPDLYVVKWTDVEGDSTFHAQANALWQPENRGHGINFLSAADGSFSFPLDALPIGETIEERDPVGTSLGFRRIAFPVVVTADADSAGFTRTGRDTLQEGNPGERLRITVR